MSESAKNAIQQDALEQSELESGATNDNGADEQQEQHVSPRMSAMDLIAESRRKALEAEGRDIIHMEIGEPDFPTPDYVVAAAVAAAQDPVNHRYSPAAGLPAFGALDVADPDVAWIVRTNTGKKRLASLLPSPA